MRAYLTFLAAATVWGASPAPDNMASSQPVYNRTINYYTSERLPGWLKLSGEFRTRVEGRTGFNFQSGNDDAYALFRTRANIEVTPVSWLDFYFQGQDARASGLAP